MEIREGLTFDDVLLEPGPSEVMPTQVTTETSIEADHVYVIPPGKDLEMDGGAVVLVPRGGEPLHLPVDGVRRPPDLGALAIDRVAHRTRAAKGDEDVNSFSHCCSLQPDNVHLISSYIPPLSSSAARKSIATASPTITLPRWIIFDLTDWI